MKKIEAAQLEHLGATKRMLDAYTNTDPLTIRQDTDTGLYDVDCMGDIHSEMTATDLLGYLNDLADESTESANNPQKGTP